MTAGSEGTAQGAASPAGRPAPFEDGRRPGRFGWVFAAVWLFYLLQPLRDAWSSRTAPLPWRVLAVAALLAFAGGFLAFFVWWRSRRAADGSRRPADVWLALAIGSVLLALAAPAGGESTLGGLVYLGVTASMTLPLRRSLAVVAALVLLAVGLPRVVPGWTPQDGFVTSLLLACFAAYGISQVIERNAQLARAREQLVDLAVTRERERMGRDVHDILGHSLTVIAVKTELAGRLLEELPAGPAADRARAEVADVERLAREALADVRATVSGTRHVSLTGELATARQALAAAGIAADLPSAVDVVPARHRELFAWALREGVTNVVRHSGATWCGVRLTADCVEIRDDGRGPGGCGTGSGLAGLRTRAEQVRARVEIERAPESGFLLRVVAGGGAA
ncbi:MAG: histidine kinase [Frankiales bacterium]|nr:histidine kinase [Frankiales bacterium]